MMASEMQTVFTRDGHGLLKLVALVSAALLFSAPVPGEDRLDMDAVAIKGTRELPKVLYIVPWKSARLGSLVAGAGSDTFSADWTALDRSVFRRQVAYYDTLYSTSDSPGVR